jgi:thiamine-monophosphate kinase
MAELGLGDEPILSDIGERRLIDQELGSRYGDLVTFGDDCSLVRQFAEEGLDLVATTDPCPFPLVASLGWDDPYYWGWLLSTINLSDLAAAGAQPLGLMVSYILPPKMKVIEFRRLIDGVDDCCNAHGTRVLGGNLAEGSAVQLTATAIGVCRTGYRLSRRGAESGDALVLVGACGYLWGTALLRLGFASLSSADENRIFSRALKPAAQLVGAHFLNQLGVVKAAVDNSDGLYAAVAAICAASNLGADVEEVSDLDESLAEICAQCKVPPFRLIELWGDWPLLVAISRSDVSAARQGLLGLGIDSVTIGYLRQSPGIEIREGEHYRKWSGVDSERFTRTSWNADLVGSYISRLVDGS